MAEIECRHFTGYKPCDKNQNCDALCSSRELAKERVLIVHLEALGAVLRSTSLLAAIKRKYPRAHITWVTKAPAQALLQNLRQIDRVLTLVPEDLLNLSALEFDIAYVIDKSLVAAGVLARIKVRETYGFRADALTGAIIPANPEAQELWHMGLSDQKKFFENKKSEQQLVHESLALGIYARDEYALSLSREECELVEVRRELWSRPGAPTIGINTGCSPTLKHKKLTIEGHRRLIQVLLAHDQLRKCPIVLLGGPEDRARNEAIAKDLPVILSPTERGLRDGLASVAAVDLVFSGDSLGMHMAIGLKKWVVAWFGPSCEQEIDLYGRGVKLMTKAPCSPCWKRVCEKPVMCYDQVDFKQAAEALAEGINWHISSSKLHFPEISFSPSL